MASGMTFGFVGTGIAAFALVVLTGPLGVGLMAAFTIGARAG
jgi:hypothetical protein